MDIYNYDVSRNSELIINGHIYNYDMSRNSELIINGDIYNYDVSVGIASLSLMDTFIITM